MSGILNLFGASLSEPQIHERQEEVIYIYRMTGNFRGYSVLNFVTATQSRGVALHK